MKCLAINCEYKVFLKGMCYIHHVFRIKMTKYYHKIGDKLLEDDYNLLPNEKELNDYNEEEINRLIYTLFDKISKWKYCLYARKQMEKVYSTNDYGHMIFINNIIDNIIFIEKYISNCYKFLIKKDGELLNIEDKYNYDNNINKYCNNKKNKKKALPMENLKKEKLNYSYIDNILIIKKYDLNKSVKIMKIIDKIYCLNYIFKNLFTEKIENDTIFILNNSSYCVFIKEIFNKCGTKYIKINYNIKNKEIGFQLNYLLEENDYENEISNLQKFHDEIKIWIKRTIIIIYDINYNCKKIYESFIKYKTNKRNSDCDCKNCMCYFEDVDKFIQKYYDILCIHIENGNINNICLEKRHKRVLRKELINIEDILNEIDIINNSLTVPNDFEEALCFWILNNLMHDNNIKLVIIKRYINSCVDNNIFSLCSCINLNNYIYYDILKSILTYGCNVYITKNNKSIRTNVFEDISFEYEKETHIYIYNNNFEIKNKNNNINNIIIHFNCI